MQEEWTAPRDLSVPWHLPADPTSVTRARHATRRHLSVAGVTDPDLLDTAELLVSELTSNVVKHTGGRPSLRVVQGEGVIRVEVTDHDPEGVPVEQDLDVEALSGRGLHLVAALSQSWGYERDTDVKRTWFELALDHSPTETTTDD